MSIFGEYFMALDYNYTEEKLYSFDTYRENRYKINLIGALPDNSRIMFYNRKSKKLISVTRKKQSKDKVYEHFSEFKL